jgi:peptidyl-prolyl cis-trans isomerase B (cyclophilin B)
LTAKEIQGIVVAMKHIKIILAAFIAACVFAGCTADTPTEQAAPEVVEMEGSTEGGAKYEAVITVKDYGEIVFEMEEGTAPQTVNNFVKLAESGFYDGLTFHRLKEGFVAQGGDPTGTGTGGSDETIQGEFAANGFNNTLKHVRGTVSMARSSGYNSASSQFFIVQEDAPNLNGSYAAFGTVTSGMDVVDAILADANPTDSNGSISADAQPVIESIVIHKLSD